MRRRRGHSATIAVETSLTPLIDVLSLTLMACLPFLPDRAAAALRLPPRPSEVVRVAVGPGRTLDPNELVLHVEADGGVRAGTVQVTTVMAPDAAARLLAHAAGRTHGVLVAAPGTPCELRDAVQLLLPQVSFRCGTLNVEGPGRTPPP